MPTPCPACGLTHTGFCQDAIKAHYEGDMRALRVLLWREHGCQGKYGDDGELQCSRCMIDFKRDSIEQIEERLTRRNLECYREAIK